MDADTMSMPHDLYGLSSKRLNRQRFTEHESQKQPSDIIKPQNVHPQICSQTVACKQFKQLRLKHCGSTKGLSLYLFKLLPTLQVIFCGCARECIFIFSTENGRGSQQLRHQRKHICIWQWVHLLEGLSESICPDI